MRSVAADFGNRFAAEIRLPEALEEKLLCPFHYFAVADPVSVAGDNFWKNGRYDVQALEKVYIGSNPLAQQRVETVLDALARYEPDLAQVRGIGFCVSVNHAEFMATECNQRGIKSAVLVGETEDQARSQHIEDLRAGRLTFLFTRDVLNEGLDVPEVNTVLFLRPTESLTIFLQQLGRGLRHSPGKDCLAVLDFVGQVHRRYRIDRKLKALLAETAIQHPARGGDWTSPTCQPDAASNSTVLPVSMCSQTFGKICAILPTKCRTGWKLLSMKPDNR